MEKKTEAEVGSLGRSHSFMMPCRYRDRKSRKADDITLWPCAHTFSRCFQQDCCGCCPFPEPSSPLCPTQQGQEMLDPAFPASSRSLSGHLTCFYFWHLLLLSWTAHISQDRCVFLKKQKNKKPDNCGIILDWHKRYKQYQEFLCTPHLTSPDVTILLDTGHSSNVRF